MKLRHVALALTLPLGLAACVTPPPPPPGPAAGCNADRAQDLVGRQLNGGLANRAKDLTGSRQLRVIRPGAPVTMDYRTDRLNIEVDGRRYIKSIRCG